MPGEPSIITISSVTRLSLNPFLTSDTNIPDVPLPILSSAVEKTASDLYNMSSPATSLFIVMAFTGQTYSQRLQPSHAKGFTL